MRASESSVSAEQTLRFRHTRQLHRNEIDLDDIVFQSCNLDDHYKHEEYESSRSCNHSCSFLDALPVFGFDGETLLSGSHTAALTQTVVKSDSSCSLFEIRFCWKVDRKGSTIRTEYVSKKKYVRSEELGTCGA